MDEDGKAILAAASSSAPKAAPAATPGATVGSMTAETALKSIAVREIEKRDEGRKAADSKVNPLVKAEEKKREEMVGRAKSYLESEINRQKIQLEGKTNAIRKKIENVYQIIQQLQNKLREKEEKLGRITDKTSSIGQIEYIQLKREIDVITDSIIQENATQIRLGEIYKTVSEYYDQYEFFNSRYKTTNDVENLRNALYAIQSGIRASQSKL